MKKVLNIFVIAALMTSCGWVQQKQREGVAVELKGQMLTYEQLDQVTRGAASVADSAALAQAYIEQWAIDILEYDEARDRAIPELERLVEDYRRSLYVHEYEQNLVARNKPEVWPDSMVQQLYEQHKQNLVLKETIIKGVLLVVPKNTPQIKDAMKWLKDLNETNIEKIEKYAYQYGTGYEYFPQEWHTANQIILRLPLETDILTERIRSTDQITVEDSVSVYMLQVTDKYLLGETMPLDYAQENIKQLLLTQWQMGFLKNERQQLFKEAERFNKLKRYER